MISESQLREMQERIRSGGGSGITALLGAPSGLASTPRRAERKPGPRPFEGPVDELLVLWGHCPSKKNLWKRGQAGEMYLEAEVTEQITVITQQAMFKWGSRGPVESPELTVKFFVTAKRQDRDGMYTTVLDCLQKAGVLVNDNIKQNNARNVLEPCEFVEPADERVEIQVRKI